MPTNGGSDGMHEGGNSRHIESATQQSYPCREYGEILSWKVPGEEFKCSQTHCIFSKPSLIQGFKAHNNCLNAKLYYFTRSKYQKIVRVVAASQKGRIIWWSQFCLYIVWVLKSPTQVVGLAREHPYLLSHPTGPIIVILEKKMLAYITMNMN